MPNAFTARQRDQLCYYGLTGNFEALQQFRSRLRRIWREWMNRRPQRKGVTSKRFREYLKRNPLPRAVITQPAIA